MDLDVCWMELKMIGETLQIPYRCVNWERMMLLDDDTFDRIWRPFILSWYHPYSEWYMDQSEDDIRTREWKFKMIDLYKACGCWLEPNRGRPVFRRRL
jgi:hypothetical protein